MPLHLTSRSECDNMRMWSCWLCVSWMCLANTCGSAQEVLTSFQLLYSDLMFKKLSKVAVFKHSSMSKCVTECFVLNTTCGCFALDINNTCSISDLRLNTEVNDPNLVFDDEQGSRIFGKLSGKNLLFYLLWALSVKELFSIDWVALLEDLLRGHARSNAFLWISCFVF